jgi:hypothetical protein
MLVAGLGLGLGLAGCELFDTERAAAPVVEEPPQMACYREARYLQLDPDTCARVGGTVVADVPNDSEDAPRKAPTGAVVAMPLPAPGETTAGTPRSGPSDRLADAAGTAAAAETVDPLDTADASAGAVTLPLARPSEALVQ